MKAIDIFALTRINEKNNLKRLEKQMSDRSYYLNIKEWELDCLRDLADKLYQEGTALDEMEFYYSFQIPKLGKEFDLLRVTDDYIINVELKSGDVSDEKVRRQLLRNRYYLVSLGKTIRSYTYIKDDDRLVRLTNGENLVESSFEKLKDDLEKAGQAINCDIESLFKEDNYIISPLSDPERFLRRDYFLTSQQNDIRKNILGKVKETSTSFQGFTGLPGTGKTLLLYDLAMELSFKQKVCVFHFGSFPEELEILDERLKRIDFLKGQIEIDEAVTLKEFENKFNLSDYQVIFIDEGHRITEHYLTLIKEYASYRGIPVIFSYDSEDAISPDERKNDPALLIEAIPDFIKYKITNRIRMNKELSSFINCLMRPDKYRRNQTYPNISVSYANDLNEANIFISKYVNEGYVYISDPNYRDITVVDDKTISAEKATCREFDKVVMLVDSTFSYDDEYLRCTLDRNGESGVRMLFHGLNRAKLKISIVILENQEMLDNILHILQG